jgi:ABC-type methionine transport system permease subunit
VPIRRPILGSGVGTDAEMTGLTMGAAATVARGVAGVVDDVDEDAHAAVYTTAATAMSEMMRAGFTVRCS